EVVATIVAGLPVFAAVMLLGGVAASQVLRVFLVTIVAAVMAGSLGVLVAFWREKTFQTLALVVLGLGFWLGGCELFASNALGRYPGSETVRHTAVGLSPLRAVMSAAVAADSRAISADPLSDVTHRFLIYGLLLSAACLLVTMARVRIWASQDEVPHATRMGNSLRSAGFPRTLSDGSLAVNDLDLAETARAEHIDARGANRRPRPHREVWDNPVLWRECATWSHGRKVILIRVAYLIAAGWIAVALHQQTSPEALEAAWDRAGPMPLAAQPLAAMYVLSLAILNALAVTSITGERDGQALDLLLATDLTPKEFLFGKLGGIVSVGGLMILVPLLVSAYVWYRGGLSLQTLAYLCGALLTLDVFTIMLGVHSGMRYAQSRAAISVSMGTFFFLSLGVGICIFLMISFAGSFQFQLVPFTAMILGGGVGLFAALSAGHPSGAMVLASLTVPFFTFYVLTCVLLGQDLPAFLVLLGSYGFATAAMMVPAIFEFDFAMGRTMAADE
ncbi:MAG TPA: hypothetical protein VIY86_15365, partial [Pirellulaceae bacterium]